MNNAPIVLFVYNRPWHTRRVLDSLAMNKESKDCTLFIYCDGPKNFADEDVLKKIVETRAVVKTEGRFKKVFVIEHDKNRGLADSIINGVTEVLGQHDRVIVLEDDLLLSPYFLFYMNDSLSRYESNDNVGQVGACNFFACGKKYPTTFFLPIPDCWGWATWKTRWAYFNADATSLLKQLEEKKLTFKFNGYGSSDMVSMMKMQIDGEISSWAIRWQAVCIINNWLTLYPNPSVTNHMESQDATHTNSNIIPPICTIKPNLKTIEVIEIPEIIEAMKKGYAGTGDYYGNTLRIKRSWIKKIIPKVWKIAKEKLGLW